jgi:hypothetical protein
MIPIQIRNDSTELFESPENSVITDSNSVAIQIHESYDIRNDDINEDYVVSYENEYLLNNNDNSPENTLSGIVRTPEQGGTTWVGVRGLSGDGLPSKDNVRTPYATQKQRRIEGVRGITGEDLSLKVITDTQKLQQSFLQKVNNELNTSMRTPTSKQEQGGIDCKEDLSSKVIEGKCFKTDSMLFHQSPEMCHDGLSPTNNRSKLINAFLMANSPLSSHTNSDSDSDGELLGNVRTPYATQKQRRSEGVRGITGEDLSSKVIEPSNAVTTNSRYLIQEHIENAISKRKMNYKKISYEEIERSLSKYYDKNNKYSNEVDTLITFIRGRKHLYNQSCYITQIKLYALTITALSITSLITVVTPFIQQYWWRIIFVMSGNAITTVLITILKYMRFESSCNTFTLLSNHYEHYEHSLQITSNKLVFIQDEKEQTKLVLDKMQEIEFKMRETAELCPIIIPIEVQNTFPVIYQTNIFSLIKRMDTHRKTLILQLKNIKNEIRYILYKWNGLSNLHFLEDTHETRSANEHIQIQREKIRLLFLMDQKENIKKELIEYKDNYTQIDDLFMKEIKYAETNKKCWKWLSCNTQKIQYTSYTNPVIKEHLELILS